MHLSDKSTVRPSTWIFLGCAITFYCLDYFFRISPSLVVDSIMQQYHVGSLGIGSMASAFYLGYVLFQLPGGFLLDRFRVIPILVIAVIVCSSTFILFTVSNNPSLGIFYRFLIGLSSALSFNGVLYIAREFFPESYFTKISGITIGISTFIASVLQTLSAEIMQHKQWQSVYIGFGIFGIFLGVSLFILFSSLKKKPKHHTQEQQIPFKILFKDTLKLIKHRNLFINGMVGSLFYLPTSVFAGLWGISYLQLQYGLDRSQASIGIMLLFLGWSIGAPLIGAVADRIEKYRSLIVFNALIAAIITTALIYFPVMNRTYIFSLLFGFGLFSSAQVIVWKIYSHVTPKNIAATGIAFTNGLIMLGISIFQLLVGKLLNVSLRDMHHHWIADMGIDKFQHAFIIIPCAFLLSAILVQFICLEKSC